MELNACLCAVFLTECMPVYACVLNVCLCAVFLTNFEIATADLLCEGKYAEMMQAKPKTGSTIVSYVWGCFQIGSLIAATFVGPVAGLLSLLSLALRRRDSVLCHLCGDAVM